MSDRPAADASDVARLDLADAGAVVPGVIVTFVSGSSGIGRTSAVANVAWILAAAGKRVLVADWSSEAASVDRYLAPFYLHSVNYAEKVRDAISSLMSSGWGNGADSFRHFGDLISRGARRYAVPESAEHIDLISHSATDAPYRPAPPLPDDEILVATLREAVRSLNYDYILIDAPTDTSRLTTLGVARLTDVAVTCFTMRRQAITDAAAQARALRDEATHAIRLVVTATQVDDRDGRRVAQSRAALHEAFADFLGDGEDGGAMSATVTEIPYEPYDAYDERLATLIDDPANQRSLLHAYERLTGVISRGEVTALPLVSSAVRTRYRRALDASYGGERETMLIAYAVEDRPWADWVRHQMASAGVDVEKLAPGAASSGESPPPILAILSPHLSNLRIDESPPSALLASADRPVLPSVVGIRVSDVPPDPDLAAIEKIDLTGCDHDGARARLLSYFGLIAVQEAPGPMSPQYPGLAGLRHPRSNLPARNPSFVGRDGDLETLRDEVTMRRGPYVLVGPAGVGKSEIAREYAHRFALDYDIIWWIAANDERVTRQDLTALAAELVDPVPETGDVVTAVLAMLSADPHRPRYLLIYDDAGDFATFDGLLPRDGGHVLVTTRAADWPASAEISSFSETESAALLRGNVPQITDEDLRQVADAVDRLPFSLQLAGAWIRQNAAWLRERGSTILESVEWSTAEFVARLEQQVAERRQQGTTGSFPISAEATVAVSFSSLADDECGRLAIRLLEMCAFLSYEGVARWLLCSRPMLSELIETAGDDGHVLQGDALMLHQVFWKAVSFGLAEVDWGRRASLRMHHMQQQIVRQLMKPADREARRAAVLRALAATVPTEADDSAVGHEEVFAELQKHFMPSGATRSQDQDVRRWVVSQIRYLYVSGDAETWRTALQTATSLMESWTATFGSDDELRLRLAVHAARLQRALGNNEAALLLVEDALSHQRRSLGLTHHRTLMSGRGRAADLRGVGRFAEALAEDQATWSGYRKVFGDDHPETLMAANNLALSSFLAGDHRAALMVEEDVHQRRRRLFGPDDPAVLWLACSVGSYRREAGDLHGAQYILQDTLQRLRQHHPNRLLDQLRTTKALATTECRLKRTTAAQEHSVYALRGYREALGETHPDTLSSMLCRATVLNAVGEPMAASELARACLRGYRTLMGEEHPFTHLCGVNVGLFLLGTDDIAQSLQTTRGALDGLRRQLGEQHPWTIAAAINHACSLAASGAIAEALELDRATAADAREFLGLEHPYTSTAAQNRNNAQSRTGDAGRGASRLFNRKAVDVDVPQT